MGFNRLSKKRSRGSRSKKASGRHKIVKKEAPLRQLILKSKPGPNRRLQASNGAKDSKRLCEEKRKAIVSFVKKSKKSASFDFHVLEEEDVLQKKYRGQQAQRVDLKERVRFKSNSRNWTMTWRPTKNRNNRP